MNKYFSYWGKTSKDKSHPLIYHSLDTGAVASAWLQNSKPITSLLTNNKPFLTQLLLFFTAIHDFGKLDARFQIKAPAFADTELKIGINIRKADWFNHSEAGYKLFFHEIMQLYSIPIIYEEWASESFKHHGKNISNMNLNRYINDLEMEDEIIKKDKAARKEFIEDIMSLFGVNSFPEIFSFPKNALAGFISICDWIASNEAFFSFENMEMDLKQYFDNKVNKAKEVLSSMGLISSTTGKQCMQIFPEYTPNPIQKIMSDCKAKPSLTIIEASTGSGKTEAALAYATKLINAGFAESIIFALPTQASANAMFARLQKVSKEIFKNNEFSVLAHGKAQFNKEYLSHISTRSGNSGNEGDSFSEAVNWISQSRKRAFLGQIGVCTIDQVLLSVLPLKHNFVRSFGLSKSVLIVDEIHAYDTYMNGLLDEVVKRQAELNSPVILLSATIQSKRRKELLNLWNGNTKDINLSNSYPLISCTGSDGEIVQVTPLDSVTASNSKSVKLLKIETDNMHITEEVLQLCIDCASKSGRVAVICNTVKEAQYVAKKLQELVKENITVKLFHSKYRFSDRLAIEEECLKECGKEGNASEYILVATQVVEQSVDLDFDFMVTQLCPADLLFQRLGRLHRHNKKSRAKGYEQPQCLLVIPKNKEYGDSKYVYENILALWATEELIRKTEYLEFPKVYREWIESVYCGDYANAPKEVQEGYNKFCGEEMCRRSLAKNFTDGNYIETDDIEKNCNALTRDSDSTANLVPYFIKGGKKVFLDETEIPKESDLEYRELISLNTITVSDSWVKGLQSIENASFFVEMTKIDDFWESCNEKREFKYSKFYGLEKVK